MSEHIDIANHRDGGDDYLKPDRLMTRRETPREFIDSEGGARIDMSESAASHLIRPPHREVPYTVEFPDPIPARRALITGALAALAAVAVCATVGFAAGVIVARWPF